MLPLVWVQFIVGQFIDNPDDTTWSFWLQNLVVSKAELGRSDAELGRSDAELGRSGVELGRPDAELGRSDAELGRPDDRTWSFQ